MFGRRARARRVLIVVQNLPLPLDRRVWLECGALTAAGIGVSVVCPKGDGSMASSFQYLDGVRIHRYDPPPVASGALGYVREFLVCWLRTAVLVWREYRAVGFQVLQTCNPPDTYWALSLLLRPFGVRFVYDQHDLCPEVYLSRFGDQASSRLHRMLVWLERATYRSADRVISTNESYRQVAITRGHVDPERITIVRSGPDPDRLRPVPAEADLRRGRTHLCCYLGVMGPQDRVDLIVEAVDHLVHRMGRTDTQFALLGFGDCFDELQAMVKARGLADFIDFTGRADDDMIRRYLSTADLGLAPDPKSPLNDVSTHNKVMEYMACATPVISFDLVETRVSAGAAAEYVTPDEDPVAFAHAIDELLDDPERRAEMGRLGRERVERDLAWKHQAPNYVSVFTPLFD
ncbi:MAG: glycosyltransferase family 4 protein [Acidimicrobiia bacterium]